MSKRIDWIDIARGCGIVLVILGHCFVPTSYIGCAIYSFHMPLFFLISGLFDKTSSDNNSLFARININVKQAMPRIAGIFKSYIIWILIGAAVTLCIPYYREQIFDTILSDIYKGYPSSVMVSSVWYLLSICLVTLMYAVIKSFPKKLQRAFSAVILFLVAAIFSVIRYKFGHDARMPLTLDASFLGLLFYWVGAEFNPFIIKTLDNFTAGRCFALMSASAALYVLGVWTNKYVNLHGLTLNNWLLYIINALLGITVVFAFSKLIENIKASKILSYLGKNTLVILGFQAIAVRIYLLAVNRICDAQYKLYSLPLVHSVISSVIIILMSLAVCFIYNKCKKIFIKNKGAK